MGRVTFRHFQTRHSMVAKSPRAFTHADAIIVAPMDFLRLPLIAVVGLMVYNEPLNNPAVLAGGGVVVLANLVNVWAENRRNWRAGAA